MSEQICWDEHGGLYLPPKWAYIGVAMDRRDAADEIQRAFDMAARARRGEPMYPWEPATSPALTAQPTEENPK